MTPQTDDYLVFTHIHIESRGVSDPVVFTLTDAGKIDDKDDLKVVRNADNSVTFIGVWKQSDNGKLSDAVNEICSAQPDQDIELY